MTDDDDLTPEFEAAFTEFDAAVDSLGDDFVDRRLARVLGRPAADPSWAPAGYDDYLDTALQRGQEIIDRAHRDAAQILAEAKKRARELIADAGNSYVADGLGSLWCDDSLRAVKLNDERVAGSAAPGDDSGPAQSGKLTPDEAAELVRVQMFSAYRLAPVIPYGRDGSSKPPAENEGRP